MAQWNNQQHYQQNIGNGNSNQQSGFIKKPE